MTERVLTIGDVRVMVVDPQTTRELRRSVLRPLAGPDDALPGDDLADAVHFAALDDDGVVLSTCFVYPDPWSRAPGEPAWHLRQMATDPAHRGRGAGAAIVRAVVEHVADRGGGILWCRARESAVEFYRRYGFSAEGGLYPGGWPAVPHRDMWRPVATATTPTSGHVPLGADR